MYLYPVIVSDLGRIHVFQYFSNTFGDGFDFAEYVYHKNFGESNSVQIFCRVNRNNHFKTVIFLRIFQKRSEIQVIWYNKFKKVGLKNSTFNLRVFHCFCSFL